MIMRRILLLLMLIPLFAYAGYDNENSPYFNKEGTRNVYINDKLVFKDTKIVVLYSKVSMEMYIVLDPDSLPRGISQKKILKYKNVFLTGIDNLIMYLDNQEVNMFAGVDTYLRNRTVNPILRQVRSDFKHFDCYEFIEEPLFYYSILIRGELYIETWNCFGCHTRPIGICNPNAYYQMLIPAWPRD